MICSACLLAIPTNAMIYFHSESYDSDEKRPWAARICGVEESGLLKREFLNGLNDYANVKRYSRGRLRGIEIQFVFRVGWVVELQAHEETRSYFMIASPTEKQAMTAKEVLQWALIQQNAR